MKSRHLLHVGVLGLALLLGGGTLVSHARTNDAPKEGAQAALPGAIASVDMDRLYDSSDGMAQLNQYAAQVGTEIGQRIENLAGAPYLTVPERSELADLLDKPTLTDAEQARIKTLKGLSDQRTTELQTLQVKQGAALTDADKARMAELTAQKRMLDLALPAIRENAQQTKNVEMEAFRRAQYARLRQVVAQAAKAKGIAHVFDINTLVYSTVDLTPNVMDEMKKHPGK